MLKYPDEAIFFQVFIWSTGYASVPPMQIVLRINTNQEKLHRMRLGENISLKNPFPDLFLHQDRINTMRYDNMCKLIRTEHELIGCNRMQ